MNKVIILPPAKIGILGGGQLGLMFTIAAKQMGYKVMVVDADINSPAAKLADEHVCLDFDDLAIVEKMSSCSAITIEFENIAPSLLQNLAKYTKITPSARCVQVLQNRILEKNWINKSNFKTTIYCEINKLQDITRHHEKYLPGILKTITLGYDGKGQQVIKKFSDLELAFQNLGKVPCILEKFLDIDKEISVVVCRLDSNNYSIYPVIENIHKDGILDYSKIPSNLSIQLEQEATEIALKLANSLDYVGVLTVEMFIVQNKLYINELAPRPHNSGHFSIDACEFSQFEQQVRIMCGLQPANTDLLKQCCMSNLLGQLWLNNDPPNLSYILQEKNVKLHLYGKKIAKLGRKMGHFTVLDKNIDNAVDKALSIRKKLEEKIKNKI